jgi:hypothetical protein
MTKLSFYQPVPCSCFRTNMMLYGQIAHILVVDTMHDLGNSTHTEIMRHSLNEY